MEQQTVAVKIAERSEGAVAVAFGSEAARAPFDATMVEHSANIVEHLTDVNAVLDKLSARSLNVRTD